MSATQRINSTPSFEAYGGSAPEYYERYFVPAIGGPMAHDLMTAARLLPGERVLDVACGTGIVARLAVEQIGTEGTIVGVDINSGMLALARSLAPRGSQITWLQASAESMPLPDHSFDVVLCQLGFQFFADKPAALREMKRVLVPEGRVLLTVPGPTPPLFAAMETEIARHVSPDVSRFLAQVFSVHDVEAARTTLEQAGFAAVDVVEKVVRFSLPGPEDFFWQYAFSTPLAAALAELSTEQRAALEQDIIGKWQPFIEGPGMATDVRVLTAAGRVR